MKDTADKKRCMVKGCNHPVRKHIDMDLCRKHYQMYIFLGRDKPQKGKVRLV